MVGTARAVYGTCIQQGSAAKSPSRSKGGSRAHTPPCAGLECLHIDARLVSTNCTTIPIDIRQAGMLCPHDWLILSLCMQRTGNMARPCQQDPVGTDAHAGLQAKSDVHPDSRRTRKQTTQNSRRTSSMGHTDSAEKANGLPATTLRPYRSVRFIFLI